MQQKTLQIPIFLQGFVTNRQTPFPQKCYVLCGRSPLDKPNSAQKKISVTQTRIKNLLFFDIFEVFPPFFVIMNVARNVKIFGNFFQMCPKDQFGLATPAIKCILLFFKTKFLTKI